MELYQKLIKLGCFTREELVQLVGVENTANSTIYRYQKKGYIEQIRRNLYAVISLETHQPIWNRWQIATKIKPDACVSHHSAFEHLGYSNQVFYTVYVASEKYFADFVYDGITYHHVTPKKGRTLPTVSNHVRSTTVEQTLIDSLCDADKIAGMEEVIRCILLIPSLNAEALLSELANLGNGFLYQKVGYVLESMNDQFHFPDTFFDECEKHISVRRNVLYQGLSDKVYNERWHLYVPKDFNLLTGKGVENDASI